MQQTSLQVWLERLLTLHTKEIDLGLERVRKVATRLNVLTPAPYVITVSGTNGKGSSVAMLVSILKAAGYRVGSYTSPHILKFNERIQIDGQMLDDQVLVNAFERIDTARIEASNSPLTYFEFSTLAALLCFVDAKLDVVVLEVGLGGRLDAVNIVDADASLITSIDLDHADWLGSDREGIGFEKAGIMRSGKLAVCSDPSAPTSLIEYANKLGVDLKCLGKDFQYSVVNNSGKSTSWSLLAQKEIKNLPKPALLGDFQLQNAAGVLTLLQSQTKLNIDRAAIEKGLQQVTHPGRLQKIVINHQAWCFDVAHNPQSALALASYMSQQSTAPRLAIFSALKDKDFQPMVTALKPWVEQWLLVDLAVDRAASLSELNQALTAADIGLNKTLAFDRMSLAIEYAKQSEYKEVLVFGSFVTVAQAMEQVCG